MYGCIYQTEDERCMKFSNGKSQSWCVEKDEPCGYRKPSNGDRIRTMSDEELANLVTDDMCELLCGAPLVCEGQCKQKMLDWLRQEAKDD